MVELNLPVGHGVIELVCWHLPSKDVFISVGFFGGCYLVCLFSEALSGNPGRLMIDLLVDQVGENQIADIWGAAARGNDEYPPPSLHVSQ